MAYMDKAKTVEWETPQSLFDHLDSIYHFTLDPASTDDNAKCAHHYTMQDNGLLLPWGGSCGATLHTDGSYLHGWRKPIWRVRTAPLW